MLLLVFQTLEMLTVSEEILLTLAMKMALFSLLAFLSLFFSVFGRLKRIYQGVIRFPTFK